MLEFDFYYFFSFLLMLFVWTYTILCWIDSVRTTRQFLRGQDEGHRLMRLYLSHLLVTIRLKPLAEELLQIGLWVVILGVLVWLRFFW
jgi:hypothetical protein